MGTSSVLPVLVAELLAEGERMPVHVHVTPLSAQAGFDVASIDLVVNTHLHVDHCGGNHLFAGRPVYVQRRELDDARSLGDDTIREWVDAPGVAYVPEHTPWRPPGG